MDANLAAIILASGSGSRTGLNIPKQFIKIAGQPVLSHTLRAFVRSGKLAKIVVVANPSYLDWTKRICDRFADARIVVVEGDETRQGSSLRGISSCPEASHVIIHDAARPLISTEMIHRICDRLQTYDAVDVCVPSTDTVVVQSGAFVGEIPPRQRMMLGQTPQAFRRDLIIKAHAEAAAAGVTNSTDDCSLVLRLGTPIFIEQGERANMKITHLDDIYLVERLFQVARAAGAVSKPAARPVLGESLVIGGSSGIGKAVVDALHSRGTPTVVASRRTNPSIDVTCSNSVKKLVTSFLEHGRVFDNIIYSAGILIRRAIAECDEREWDDTIATNLKGVFLFLREIKRLLYPGGHFVVIGSSSYSLGRAGYAAYSSSKAALINLIQAAADEFPEFHVNVISPQGVQSEMRSKAFGSESEKLLDLRHVGESIVEILGCELSGMNFDIRVDAPLRLRNTEAADYPSAHQSDPDPATSGPAVTLGEQSQGLHS